MASGGSTAGHGRQEQAARLTLVWAAGARRQRLKNHYGRWMDMVWSLQLESFIFTKLTKPLVRVKLVGQQVSLRNGAPQMSGAGIIFWAGEARISKIKEEARHPLDGHPMATLQEPCVDYKLTKPCIRVNSLFLGDAST